MTTVALERLAESTERSGARGDGPDEALAEGVAGLRVGLGTVIIDFADDFSIISLLEEGITFCV